MTAQTQNSQPQTPSASPETKPNDKELNFRKQEAMYQRQLEQERQARLEAEKRLQELSTTSKHSNDDDDDGDPYVDKKKLEKKLSAFEKSLNDKIDKKAEEKATQLIEKKEQEQWIHDHPDFEHVLGHADKFAESNPSLANMLLRMPNTFDRQRLVYENIKAAGTLKPPSAQPSIQEKIDANRRSPYYQPTGIGSAPYNAGAGDFSPAGQKAAHDKMQELKAKLRI